jgi:hypothetical protein
MNIMTLCQIVSWQIDLGNLIREIIVYFIITNVENESHIEPSTNGSGISSTRSERR